jgi:hypothetical protein
MLYLLYGRDASRRPYVLADSLATAARYRPRDVRFPLEGRRDGAAQAQAGPGPEAGRCHVTCGTGIVWVAEIKSLTVKHEEKQLRLRLGQVLRCRRRPTRPVRVVERRPSDESWLESLQVAQRRHGAAGPLHSKSGTREGAVRCSRDEAHEQEHE